MADCPNTTAMPSTGGLGSSMRIEHTRHSSCSTWRNPRTTLRIRMGTLLPARRLAVPALGATYPSPHHQGVRTVSSFGSRTMHTLIISSIRRHCRRRVLGTYRIITPFGCADHPFYRQRRRRMTPVSIRKLLLRSWRTTCVSHRTPLR